MISGDKRGFSITKKRVDDMGFPLNLVSTFERVKWLEKKFNLKETIYMGDGIYDALVFEKVKYVEACSPGTKHVYCVTLNRAPRLFAVQGGVCTSNCFGYLGFKNARFGKIEAHECVNAWGREVLLRAKEAVEARGYHVLHALVDCLWVQGKTGMDHEGLRKEIEEK